MMYKVVVVDDEPWTRKGIIRAIEWEELGLSLAGEAEDGEDALGLIRDTAPHIVLMDMNMPGVDGVRLIRGIKQMHQDIWIIVISGYSKFEYTREAIVSRVFDYVLKPVKKTELNRVLKNCVTELERALSEREIRHYHSELLRRERERVIIELIRRLPRAPERSERETAFYRQLSRLNAMYAVVARPDEMTEAAEHFGSEEAALRELDLAVMASVEAAGSGGKDGCVAFIDPEKFECILVVHDMTIDVKSALRSCKFRFPFSAGIGGTVGDPDSLHLSYRQAVQALKRKKAGETGVILTAEDGPSARPNPPVPAHRIHAAATALRSGNLEQALTAFREIAQDWRGQGATVEAMQNAAIALLGEIDRAVASLDLNLADVSGYSYPELVDNVDRLYSPGDIEVMLGELAGQVVSAIRNRNRAGVMQAVKEMAEDVSRLYFKPLSLHDYADKYHLNPNYLRRVFKSETGKSFMELLTETRMARAKELLAESDLKINEVARHVGYEDYRLFNLVFKKSTGITPGMYRLQRTGANIAHHQG